MALISKRQIQKNTAKEKFSQLLNDQFVILSYNDTRTHAQLKCLKHNTKFFTIPNNCNSRRCISGCPKCNTERSRKSRLNWSNTEEKFLSLLNSDYQLLSKYKKNARIDVKIKCLKHNTIFYCSPRYSIDAKKIVGCPDCKKAPYLRNLKDILQHYKNIELRSLYRGWKFPIKSYCKTHGQVFNLIPEYLIRFGTTGCPKCRFTSVPEKELLEFIEKLIGKENIIHNLILKDKQGIIKTDIVIPKSKLIIEHNGIYYHSAITGSELDFRYKHYNRKQRLLALGYRLISIWGDTWINRKSVVKQYLKAQLCPEKLAVWDARKLKIKSVSFDFASSFVNKYHLQGQSYGNHQCLSLFDPISKKTVAVMSFSSTSRPVLHKPNTVELTRYASRGKVRGGASKLLINYLRQNPNVEHIISFSDNDYFDGKMYEAIGFKYDGEDPPTYFTIWGHIKRHKSYTKKSNLNKLYQQRKILLFNSNWTEDECLFHNEIRRCWNSGKKRWIYNV